MRWRPIRSAEDSVVSMAMHDGPATHRRGKCASCQVTTMLFCIGWSAWSALCWRSVNRRWDEVNGTGTTVARCPHSQSVVERLPGTVTPPVRGGLFIVIDVRPVLGEGDGVIGMWMHGGKHGSNKATEHGGDNIPVKGRVKGSE